MKSILKVFAAMILVLFGLTFAFCRPKVTESTISTSPDGRYQIGLTNYEVAGAAGSTYSALTLREIGKPSGKSRRMLSLRRAPPITVKWIGPNSLELDIFHRYGSEIYASDLPLAGWSIKVVEVADPKAVPRPQLK